MNEQPDFLVSLVMMYSVLVERFDVSHKDVNLFEEKRYEYDTNQINIRDVNRSSQCIADNKSTEYHCDED